MRFFSIFALSILFASTVEAEQITWAEKLATAIIQEDANQISTVLAEGHDLDMILPDGRSPIALAAVQSSPEVIDILINGGIDPDALDEAGYSAVMRALQFGRTDNAKKLHALGASLEGVTNDGYTVRLLAENVGLENFGPAYPSSLNLKMSEEEASQILLYAAEAGDLESVKFALDNGASVHAKADNGWTAAMLAGLGGHAVVLNRLILNDALEANGIYHAADDVDLITAILAGEGGGSLKNASEMLSFVINHEDVQKSGVLSERGVEYRAIAERLNYPSKTIDLLSESYSLSVETKETAPSGSPTTNEGWEGFQELLKSTNLSSEAGSKLQDATNGYEVYRPLAFLLQRKLRSQGCSVSRRGKLSTDTADGQFGPGSAAGLARYNSAITSSNNCRPLRELKQIGSREKAVEEGFLLNIWLPDALSNLSKINQCIEQNSEPVCGCGSDPAFEAKNGVCIEKTCTKGLRLNKDTGSCFDPARISNLVGREFACHDVYGQTNYYVNSAKTIHRGFKKIPKLDPTLSIYAGTFSGSVQKHRLGQERGGDFGLTTVFLAGVNLEKRQDGWICPNDENRQAVGNCMKEIFLEKVSGNTIYKGQIWIFRPFTSSYKTNIIQYLGYQRDYVPIDRPVRTESWYAVKLSQDGSSALKYYVDVGGILNFQSGLQPSSLSTLRSARIDDEYQVGCTILN